MEPRIERCRGSLRAHIPHVLRVFMLREANSLGVGDSRANQELRFNFFKRALNPDSERRLLKAGSTFSSSR